MKPGAFVSTIAAVSTSPPAGNADGSTEALTRLFRRQREAFAAERYPDVAARRDRLERIADIVTRRPYVQMQSLLDATQPKGRRYYWKSHYLPGIDDRLVDAAVTHAGRIASPHSAILLFQIEGALGELPAGHSPAGNRDAAYVLNIAGSWEQPEHDAVNIQWARDCFEATRSCSTGGTYVNFLTEEEGRDRVEAAYGRPNLDRLATIKHAHDPANFFRHTKPVAG